MSSRAALSTPAFYAPPKCHPVSASYRPNDSTVGLQDTMTDDERVTNFRERWREGKPTKVLETSIRNNY